MDGVKFPEIAVPEFFADTRFAQDAAYKSGKRYAPGFLPPGNLTMVSQADVASTRPVNYRGSS
jgi:hypothetical protein